MIDSRAIAMAMVTVEAPGLYNVRCVVRDGTWKGNKDLIEPGMDVGVCAWMHSRNILWRED